MPLCDTPSASSLNAPASFFSEALLSLKEKARSPGCEGIQFCTGDMHVAASTAPLPHASHGAADLHVVSHVAHSWSR